MRSGRIGLLGVGLALVAPTALYSQRLPAVAAYERSSLPSRTAAFQFDTTKAFPRTYWLEGGVIGGVVMGVFTIEFAHGMGEGQTTLLGDVTAFLIGGTVGFPVGALIGGQFPKH